jgi:acyl CoA:acetate/3-ketoacid CoA transferase alpha subunit
MLIRVERQKPGIEDASGLPQGSLKPRLRLGTAGLPVVLVRATPLS